MTPEELRNIIDRAHYFGLLQKNLDGQLVHAPFSLTPYQLPSSLISHLEICSRSEEHTSGLQSHSDISYAVFCLKKKNLQAVAAYHSRFHRTPTRQSLGHTA